MIAYHLVDARKIEITTVYAALDFVKRSIGISYTLIVEIEWERWVGRRLGVKLVGKLNSPGELGELGERIAPGLEMA